jgi:hypothetical protein
MALAGGLLATSAASAQGATMVGQVAPDTGSLVSCTTTTIYVQFTVQSPPEYVISAPGVITSWSMRAGSQGFSAKLKVMNDVNSAANQWQVAGTSDLANGVANTINTFPTRIPVSANQVLAVWNPGGTVPCRYDTTAANNNQVKAASSSPPPSEPAVGAAYNTDADFTAVRLNVSANVEPDNDHDGYGDETQDLCPTDPSTQGNCPGGDTTPPETTITTPPKATIKTKHKSTDVSIGFASSEPASTFSCTLDGVSTACVSPFEATVKKGSHTFSVVATDAVGNADSSPATTTFKVKRKKHKKHHHHH